MREGTTNKVKAIIKLEKDIKYFNWISLMCKEHL